MNEKKECCEVPMECVDISLKKMYLHLLKAQELLLDNSDKKEVMRLLVYVEQELLLLNGETNTVKRDLFWEYK